ncbi:MAG: response regulator [Desulfuromonadales bacterium]|nr:response regulator [Desulfuromonadales bacterium]
MSKQSKYLEIFAREAEEQLGSLRQGLLAMEKEGVGDQLINDLLRSAHTLKGSAKMVGLDELAGVAHRVESLLKKLQQGEEELTAELIDVLLVSTDAIEALAAEAHSGGEIRVNVDNVVEALETGRLGEASPAPEPAYSGTERRKTVRASVERLDELINGMGEILLCHQSLHARQAQLKKLQQQIDTLLGRLRRAENYQSLQAIRQGLVDLLAAVEIDTTRLGYQAEEVYQQTMQLRLLPLATVTDEFERSVRDLSRSLGKEVRFAVRGQEVELDRQMLDVVKPILLHVINNAVDHGIEDPATRIRLGKPKAGQLTLEADYEGSFARLTLRDDGQGMDPTRIREVAVRRGLLSADNARALSDEAALYLVLEPGFSTREFITDVSGRGVGLDVVKANLDQVKGDLLINSTVGVGTELTLRLPLSMAIFTGLVFETAGDTLVCPQNYIVEILRVAPGEILEEMGREILRFRDRSVPVLNLAGLLDLESAPLASRRLTVLLLHYRDQLLGLLVDRTVGLQEIVVKPLGSQLQSLEFISGATLLADGAPALILSVADLFAAQLHHGVSPVRRQLAGESTDRRARILVVDDSITTRTMEKNILEAHGYEVVTAVSGFDALEKLAASRFDLMVSDVEMPGMTGFELTREVRKRENTAEIPVIIVTSLAADEHRRQGIDAGAQAYIVKGNFEQGVLLETVETLIG